MENLFNEQSIYLKDINLNFKRSLSTEIPWNERLLGIQGFRGVGKTTMILQYIKETYGNSEKALFVSLDNIYFSDNRLVDMVKLFVANGGEHLFLDEVHKYPNWSVELKNIYDLHKNLKVTFTASSLLEILNSKADLSRRAIVFFMQGLSFREYLNFTLNTNFKSFNLEDILLDHKKISDDILREIKPLKHFKQYISSGYYPFFKQNKKFYYNRIQSIINMVIEIEFPLLRDVEPSKISKIKQLLYIISQSVPFKPNISKLAERVGVTRNTLVEYMNHLADTKLLNKLYANSNGIGLLQKPDKLFLENTNISFALTNNTPDIGNIRETFFLNQLSVNHNVTYPKVGDFMVDDKYLFEVGGKSKTQKQIAGIENAFIAADDIEYGFRNKIPLWLFGFMY
ncbi:MAG: AAA family ATPase [Flavobacteriia bacterium]|nr:MAG: AAA family ATPase [Flavobacteriia bacterium]